MDLILPVAVLILSAIGAMDLTPDIWAEQPMYSLPFPDVMQRQV